MGTIFAEYTSKRNSIVVYTSTMEIFLITRMMTKMTIVLLKSGNLCSDTYAYGIMYVERRT